MTNKRPQTSHTYITFQAKPVISAHKEVVINKYY